MLKDKSSVIAFGHCESYFPGDKHISIAKIFYENKHRLLTDLQLVERILDPLSPKTLTILFFAISMIWAILFLLALLVITLPLFGILANLVSVINVV